MIYSFEQFVNFCDMTYTGKCSYTFKDFKAKTKCVEFARKTIIHQYDDPCYD